MNNDPLLVRHVDSCAALSEFRTGTEVKIVAGRARQPWLRLLSMLAAPLLIAGLFIGGAHPIAVGLFASPWDKLVHGAVFGLLGVLLAVALNGARLPMQSCAVSPRQALLVAALLVAVVAGVDELCQLRLPGRVASWSDWLADVAGGALALAGLHKVWRS